MTPASRREYALAIRHRYAQASRAIKRQILTEFCRTTGYHRKYAIALLNGAPPLAPRVRRRSPIYRPHTVAILAAIWEAAEGRGSKKDIQGWVAQIKKEIETTTSDCDKEKLQERLAKLAGGVAQTKVGAATETELKEKKHRFEDALSTSKAAVEEGIFPGGGVALLNISKALGQGGRRC